jgi:hypothetical protein
VAVAPFRGYSMSITNGKPQQQTLSIRISESLREFLELAGEFIADSRGEAVSISEVAKLLLESAKQDRLDFRVEAAELQQSPTAALLHLRRNWEQHQPLSRAEWVLLAQYVQVACEKLSGTTRIPSPGSVANSDGAGAPVCMLGGATRRCRRSCG